MKVRSREAVQAAVPPPRTDPMLRPPGGRERRVCLVKAALTPEQVPFFRSVRDQLWEQHVRCDLRYGLRTGAATTVDWSAPLVSRELQLGGRTVRHLGLPRLGSTDLVVVDHDLAASQLWLRLLRRRLGGSAVAIWGDGPITGQGRVARAMLARTTAAADWYLADSRQGATAARRRLGLRVTVVDGSAENLVRGLLLALQLPDQNPHRHPHR